MAAVVVLAVAPAIADSPPSVCCVSVSNITEHTAKLEGTVNPGTGPSETSWKFQYSLTPPNESPNWIDVGGGGTLPADNTSHQVESEATGLNPNTTYYYRLHATNEAGANEANTDGFSNFETNGPPEAETFLVHAFHEGHIRVMGSVQPHGFETEYWFEFGKTTSYDDPGSPTPIGSLPAGQETRIVGADLTGLEPGATYHYRLFAQNTATGNPTAEGEDRTFVAPTPGPGGEPTCTNDAFRTGASARLPDCRAYEQVTPENKGAAMDIFGYGALSASGVPGEDGNRFVLRAPTKWGSSPDAVQSWYTFTRNGTHAWDMRSVSRQPEAGGVHYESQIFSPDLLSTALTTREEKTLGSPGTESLLRVGPVEGPYDTAAEVGFTEEGFGEGGSKWVGASHDFSRVFLQSKEHELAGAPTGTTGNRPDLYEYANGEFRQLNQINGTTIGVCGAKLVTGRQTYDSGYQTTAGPHAVSPDGSRVLFIAQPTGTSCFFGDEGNEETRLYLSVNGQAEEIPGGSYAFLGANEGLTRILLRQNGANVYLYNTETEQRTLLTEKLFANGSEISVSLDANAIYFTEGFGRRLTPEAPANSPDTMTHNQYGGSFTGAMNLYRLDVGTGQVQFITQTGGPGPRPNLVLGGGMSVSRNGQYYYWSALSPTGGLPAGTPETTQVYRYDNNDHSIQCVGCSSPFDFEPKLNNTYLPAGTFASFLGAEVANGIPNIQVASDDGDYVFFDSPSELVPQDVNGEVDVCESFESCPESDYDFTPSSDVYEWRKNGVDGCTEVQGCLRLITSGRGGSKVMLLGTTGSGNDVFFATHEKLVGQDTDDLGDVYDARVNGGYPGPPQPPAGCEGSSCQTPVPPPNDVTPGSLTTHAIGNLKHHRAKPCKKGKVRKHGKCVKKHKKQHKKKHHKKGKRSTTGNRGGRR